MSGQEGTLARHEVSDDNRVAKHVDDETAAVRVNNRIENFSCKKTTKK